MGQFVLLAKIVQVVCTITKMQFVRRLFSRWFEAPLWSITCRTCDSNGRAVEGAGLEIRPRQVPQNQPNPEASQ